MEQFLQHIEDNRDKISSVDYSKHTSLANTTISKIFPVYPTYDVESDSSYLSNKFDDYWIEPLPSLFPSFELPPEDSDLWDTRHYYDIQIRTSFQELNEVGVIVGINMGYKMFNGGGYGYDPTPNYNSVDCDCEDYIPQNYPTHLFNEIVNVSDTVSKEGDYSISPTCEILNNSDADSYVFGSYQLFTYLKESTQYYGDVQLIPVVWAIAFMVNSSHPFTHEGSIEVTLTLENDAGFLDFLQRERITYSSQLDQNPLPFQSLFMIVISFPLIIYFKRRTSFEV